MFVGDAPCFFLWENTLSCASEAFLFRSYVLCHAFRASTQIASWAARRLQISLKALLVYTVAASCAAQGRGCCFLFCFFGEWEEGERERGSAGEEGVLGEGGGKKVSMFWGERWSLGERRGWGGVFWRWGWRFFGVFLRRGFGGCGGFGERVLGFVFGR